MNDSERAPRASHPASPGPMDTRLWSNPGTRIHTINSEECHAEDSVRIRELENRINELLDFIEAELTNAHDLNVDDWYRIEAWAVKQCVIRDEERKAARAPASAGEISDSESNL